MKWKMIHITGDPTISRYDNIGRILLHILSHVKQRIRHFVYRMSHNVSNVTIQNGSLQHANCLWCAQTCSRLTCHVTQGSYVSLCVCVCVCVRARARVHACSGNCRKCDLEIRTWTRSCNTNDSNCI